MASTVALGDYPHRYPLARENAKFPCEVRVFNYDVSSNLTHRVLYTVRPDAILILSIRSVRQQDATPDDL